MRWIAISLIIGTFIGLMIRYDLGRDNWNYTYKLDVLSVRNNNETIYQIQNSELQMCSSKLFDIHLSHDKGWDVYCTQHNRINDDYDVHIEFINNQTTIRKINAYLYNVYKLCGIESLHELITHRSLIYRSVYGHYHRYKIKGSDIKRRAIIVNDIYNILNGNDIVVDDTHFEFTAIERWALDTSMATLYPGCFECSYDVLVSYIDRQNPMAYSKFINRRVEGTHTFITEKYHMLFNNDNYSVFMVFGNGKWYLNNKDCETKLVMMYADQLRKLV